MFLNSPSLVIQHALSMTTSHKGTMNIDDIISLKLSKLYLNKEIPGSSKLYMLQLKDSCMEIIESIDDCINSIDSHGGFCIVGWYKGGKTTDKSIITAVSLISSSNSNFNNNTEYIHVNSGDISHCLVQIIPHNYDFLDESIELGKQLHGKKIDNLNMDKQV